MEQCVKQCVNDTFCEHDLCCGCGVARHKHLYTLCRYVQDSKTCCFGGDCKRPRHGDGGLCSPHESMRDAQHTWEHELPCPVCWLDDHEHPVEFCIIKEDTRLCPIDGCDKPRMRRGIFCIEHTEPEIITRCVCTTPSLQTGLVCGECGLAP